MVLDIYKLPFKQIFLKLFVCIIFTPIASFSQKAFVDFELKLTIEDGSYEHAKIAISKNGTPFRTIDSKKKYDLQLDLGIVYEITASKMGYITKTIVFDTNIPEGREEDDFREFESEIILKPQPEDEEITYTQPVGRISYSNAFGDFDYDKDYSAKAQQMQKKAEADPKKRPKVKKDSVESSPQKIEKRVEAPIEKNKSVVKEKSVSTSPVPTVRTVVERTVQQDKVKITYRTVTINGVEFVYRKEEFSWGGVYFYKGTKNITENTFDNDTK